MTDGLLGRGDRFGERDFGAGLQRGHAGVSQFDDRELVRGLAQMSEADEFAADGGPFVTRVLVANSVGGQLVVAPLEHALGFGPREHLDNVV